MFFGLFGFGNGYLLLTVLRFTVLLVLDLILGRIGCWIAEVCIVCTLLLFCGVTRLMQWFCLAVGFDLCCRLLLRLLVGVPLLSILG